MSQFDDWLLKQKPPIDIPKEFSDRGLAKRSKRLYDILDSHTNYNINNKPIHPRGDIENLDILI